MNQPIDLRSVWAHHGMANPPKTETSQPYSMGPRRADLTPRLCNPQHPWCFCHRLKFLPVGMPLGECVRPLPGP